MRPDSKTLVAALLIPWHRPRCPKCFQSRTPCCCQFQILAAYHSFIPFSWYLVLAVINKRHCESFTSWAIQACKLTCLLRVTFENNQETWLLACGFAWFWDICYLAKFSRPMHSFEAWLPYCVLAFEVFKHDEDFIDKPPLNFRPWRIVILWFLILSIDWDLSQRKRKGDIHNWARKACSRC